MFFGPNAASPPKNTPGRVDAIVDLVDDGHAPLVERRCRCRARSTGNAFSWPIATSTSSQGKCTSGSPVGTSLRRPLRVLLRRDLLERHAGQLAVLVREFLRHEDSCGSGCLRAWRLPSPTATPSSRRSRERTTTLTSSPPKRRELRQQSIAVLPPPSTTTRLPIWWCGRTRRVESQSMPMWMCAAASRRPGMSRSRPRGAPLPMNTASNFSAEQRLQAIDARARRGSRRRGRGRSPISSSITDSGRRNLGIWVRIMPPACASASKTTHS